MSDKIPKSIRDEFIIVNQNIKYPTFADEDFYKSISENPIFENYTEKNMKITFEKFNKKFIYCKDATIEIIAKNMHNIQEYCSKLNLKTLKYIFCFYITEKYAKFMENKFLKMPIDAELKKDISFDNMIIDCSKSVFKFDELYKKEFKTEEEIEKLKQSLNPLIVKFNILIKMENEIGNTFLRMIKLLIKYLLTPLKKEINKFKKISIFYDDSFFASNSNTENEIILLKILLYLNKLLFMEFYFYNYAILDKEDVGNLDENSEEWNNLKKYLVRIIPKNADDIKKIMLESKNSTNLEFSLISNIKSDNSTFSLLFSGIKNFAYYKACENQTIIDSIKFQITYRPERILDLYVVFRKFKYLYSKILPDIEFRRKIYVKKELPPINKELIGKLLNFMKGDNLIETNNNIINNGNNIINIDNNIINNDYNIINNDNNNSLPIMFKDKITDKKIKRNYVSVTILHKEKLYFKNEQKEESIFSSFVNAFKKDEEKSGSIKNKIKKNTLLIHLHGGGFIGSSTFIHETYLRKWANYLGIPIIGVNYSLAPKYPYPEGLNDLYQTYMWILRHAEDELNMEIKHIILSGDSAGGNIAFGLNNLLICLKEYEPNLMKDVILPELLLEEYPVTYVNVKNCSNSFLLSLNDQVFNAANMAFSVENYRNGYNVEDDPFLNCIKINDFLLERMRCKVRIFFGSSDVLRDDGLRLLYLLTKYNEKNKDKNQIDVRGYDVIYFWHGFIEIQEPYQKISRKLIFPEIKEFLSSINN